MTLRVSEADLDDATHAGALVEIVDSYARGPGGAGEPLSDEARANLAKGLREHGAALPLLAWEDGRPVGVAICLWGFSTFAGRPLLNVHDLAVLPGHRGRGVGRRLLEEVERRARARDCCKITLEVHETNEGARRLYRRLGFGPWDPATLFVSKTL